MKQCSFIYPNGERCGQKAIIKPDFSNPPNIFRGPDPNDDNLKTLQVYFDTQYEEPELCYYHKKLTEGYLYDHRGKSPNNAYKKREDIRKAEKEKIKNLHDKQYPPTKQTRMFEDEARIRIA